MKLAFLHYSVPPIVGGVESVIAHHARLFAAHGQAVRLLAARGAALTAAIPLVCLSLADSREARGLAVKAALDVGSVPPDFAALRDEIARELQSALTGVDLLIAHNVCSLNKNLALTAALHQLHGTSGFPRLILWHHDLAWTTPRYRAELHTGYPWDLLRTDWGATHVVVSELRRRELAELLNLPPAHIRVIPNGVDLARFYKLEPLTQTLLDQTHLFDAAPLLLLPVRITPRKNIELALRVLAELRREWPRAALVVTGPLGPHNARNAVYFQHLQTLRAELGLQECAHFLAEQTDISLPDEVIADLYRVADALFLPSREEGFGIPLLEAACAHLPAFCADIPPLRELGLEYAFYFSPEADPASVAQTVAAYFQTTPVARLALRARAVYRWEAIYREFLAPLLEPEEL